MARRLLALLALVAMALGGAHTPLMAAAHPAPVEPAPVESAPVESMAMVDTDHADCHVVLAAVAQLDKAIASGDADNHRNPGCCPDGLCDGQCTPLAAFLAAPANPAAPISTSTRPAFAPAFAPSYDAAGLTRPPRLFA
jgi:hypothetical protein